MVGRGPRRGLLGHQNKGPASSGHCTEADPGLYRGHGTRRRQGVPTVLILEVKRGGEVGGGREGREGMGSRGTGYLDRAVKLVEGNRRLQGRLREPRVRPADADTVTGAHQGQVHAKFCTFERMSFFEKHTYVN